MKPLLWDIAVSVFLVVLGAPWWAGVLAFLGLRALGWLASISNSVNLMALALSQAVETADEALAAEEVRAQMDTEAS